MEITMDNFISELDNIVEAIKKADFVAIDWELTGLNNKGSQDLFDTYNERYKYMKDGSMEYLPIQFGLCVFNIKENNSFSCFPYSFYLFPCNAELTDTNTNFLMQSSSIGFLSSHNFDFNKAFSKGIGYICMGDVERLKKNLIEKQEKDLKVKQSADQEMNLKPEDEEFLTNKTNEVIDFLSNKLQDEKIVFKDLSGYHRKILFVYLAKRVSEHGSIILQSEKDETGKPVLCVSRDAGNDGQLKLLQEKHKKQLEEFEMAIGFSNIIKAISDSQVMVVGHNCYLDLLHVIHHFLFPLPDDYEEFKQMAHSYFPQIIDTKFLAHSENFSSTCASKSSLSNLLACLSEDPFTPVKVETPEIVNTDSSTLKFHDAGDDALATGKCFCSFLVQLANLGSQNNIINKDNLAVLLKPFMNKLFIMKCIGVNFINLSGEDDTPDRNNWYKCTIPADWQTQHLLNKLRPVTLDKEPRLCWENDTTVYVKAEVDDPSKIACLSDKKIGFEVVPYSQLKFVKDSINGTTKVPKRKSIDPVIEESKAKKKKLDN